MDIICCTDHNYIMPTGIMMLSLSINNPDAKVTYHIFCNKNVTSEDRENIIKTISSYNHNANFYTIDDNIGDCFTIGKDGQPKHITIASYYRLLVAKILPENIDKALYLDSDIVVCNSLKQIFETNLEDIAAGVVTDMSEGDLEPYRRLRYSPKFGYFNAGVLLLNLKYWRENNLLGKFIEFATDFPERIVFHDQDILNFVLRDKKLILPIKYNLQHGFLFRKIHVSWEYEEEIDEAINNPVIIHYTAADKPWYMNCTNPFSNVFLKYKNMSLWRDVQLIEVQNSSKNLRYYVKKILILMGILNKGAVEPLYKSINTKNN